MSKGGEVVCFDEDVATAPLILWVRHLAHVGESRRAAPPACPAGGAGRGGSPAARVPASCSSAPARRGAGAPARLHCRASPACGPPPTPPAPPAVPEPLRRWLLPHQHLYTGPLLLFAKANWNLWSLVTALGARGWRDAAGIALHYAAFIAAG